jgi:hypothetical protein
MADKGYLWDFADFENNRVPEDSEWRQIAEFPDYWVSNYLDVINLKTGHLMATYKNQRGIVCARMFRAHKGYTRSVVKLRREAFGETFADEDYYDATHPFG